MGGITYAELRNTDFGKLDSSAKSWNQLLTIVASHAGKVQTNIKGHINGKWMGTAAELAHSKVDTTHGGMIGSVEQLRNIQKVFAAAKTNLAKLHNELAAITVPSYFAVRPDGAVGYAAGQSSDAVAKAHNQAKPAAKITPMDVEMERQHLEKNIQRILQAANKADDNAAAALRGLRPPRSGGNPRPSPRHTTVSGSGPGSGGPGGSPGSGGHHNLGGGDTGAHSGDARVAQAYAREQLSRYGWSDEQMESLIKLWNQESGWNAYAKNPTSGAYGIPQSLGHGHVFDLGDYKAQIDWGLKYIRDRYGSPSAAWQHEVSHNWY